MSYDLIESDVKIVIKTSDLNLIHVYWRYSLFLWIFKHCHFLKKNCGPVFLVFKKNWSSFKWYFHSAVIMGLHSVSTVIWKVNEVQVQKKNSYVNTNLSDDEINFVVEWFHQSLLRQSICLHHWLFPCGEDNEKFIHQKSLSLASISCKCCRKPGTA